jgi:co-chaperonin GroES (HSP10)
MNKNEHQDIEAIGEWLTVTRRTAASTTDGGIHLPDTVRGRMEAEYVGTIVSIGDDAALKHPKLKLGDRIVYQRCFPMNKTDTKDEIFSLIHMLWVMGRVHSKTVQPAMAPTNEKFKQD